MGADEYFSPIPLFILFREAIEASIVVSVLLTFLNRSTPQLVSQIWWGVGAAVGVSLALGAIFAVLYYKAQQNLFSGSNLVIFKGVISWVACIFITFLAFAMLRFEGWEEKWARKLANSKVKKLAPIATEDGEHAAAADQAELGAGKGAAEAAAVGGSKGAAEAAAVGISLDINGSCLDSSSSPVLASSEGDEGTPREVGGAQTGVVARIRALYRRCDDWMDYYALFFVVFFTVLREGLESVVFLFGVGNTAPAAIPISGLIGILCGVACGVFIYYSGKQVKDIKWLLMAFAAILFFIAAGAAENGANYLMKGGMFGPYVWPSSVAVVPTAAISSKYASVSTGAMPAGFSDGDEGPAAGPMAANDGYVYVMTPAQPWWQAPLWDISSCCGDEDSQNKFLSLSKVVFGYNAKPCFIDVVFYLGYWLVVLCMGLWKWRAGTLLDADYKYKRMMKKQEEAARAKEAALAEGAVAVTASAKDAAETATSSSSTRDSEEARRVEAGGSGGQCSGTQAAEEAAAGPSRV